MGKKGILIVNLGTPDSPSTSDVRTYLDQFLMDGRVIDINVAVRAILVKGIIVPFRGPKSAKIYKEIWTEEGSPLLIYGKRVVEEIAKEYEGKAIVGKLNVDHNPKIATEFGIMSIPALLFFKNGGGSFKNDVVFTGIYDDKDMIWFFNNSIRQLEFLEN